MPSIFHGGLLYQMIFRIPLSQRESYRSMEEQGGDGAILNMSELPGLVARPFHFLIQEQAKCMVAIKELQDQVHSLQEFRSSLSKTCPDLCGRSPSSMQLRPSPDGGNVKPRGGSSGRILPSIRDGSPVRSRTNKNFSNNSSGSSNDSAEFDAHRQGSPKVRRNGGGSANIKRSPSQKFVVVAQGKNWLRIRPYIESEVEDSDDFVSTTDSLRSTMDSLRGDRRTGKQDSGFSTDQLTDQTDRSLAHSWLVPPSKDELLTLLDIIEQQGVELRSELDNLRVDLKQGDAGPMSLSDTGLQSSDLLAEVERLRRERDQLIERLGLAEQGASAAKLKALQLEERLRAATTERVQLDNRIHDMHMQFVRANGIRKDVVMGSEILNGSSENESGGPNSLPDGLLRGRIHVKPNIGRISTVLRETKVLELQRQLLTAIMENEVLKTQLEQITRDWSKRTKEWQMELDLAQQDVRTMRTALDRARMEVQADRARLRMLQRALQATHLDNHHLNNQLAQSLQTLGHSLADNYKDQATNTDTCLGDGQLSPFTDGSSPKELPINSRDLSPILEERASPPFPPDLQDSLDQIQRSSMHLSSSTLPPSQMPKCSTPVPLPNEETTEINNSPATDKLAHIEVTLSWDPVSAGITKNPAESDLQQRLQRFLQRIVQTAPLDTADDDYLETGL